MTERMYLNMEELEMVNGGLINEYIFIQLPCPDEEGSDNLLCDSILVP